MAYLNYQLPGSSPGNYEINTEVEPRMSRRRQIEWLRRSRSWKGLDPATWKARKILGMGGNGLIGLWDYHGADPKMPRHMVVKQGIDVDGMGWESRLLKVLAGVGSDHIVKIYKAVYRAAGTGTSARIDRAPFTFGYYDERREVYRLYLEYCENGDLENYADKLDEPRRRGVYAPEEHIWRIFACLAKGILVLETGTEDPDAADPTHIYPIAHFDIKPPNILIGNRDGQEHTRLNAFKLADFGIALPVPNDMTDADWIRQTRWRATEGFMSPEQRYETHPNRLIGIKTNVWATGATMHYLLTGKTVRHPTFQHKPHDSDVSFQTQGIRLLEPLLKDNPDGVKIYRPYSRHLIDTILSCLAFDPSQRLSAADLVRHTQEMLELFNQMAETGPEIPTDPLTAADLPNFPPQGYALLQNQLPPSPVLQQPTEKFLVKKPEGPGPEGPSPANPTLLFPPNSPTRPLGIWEYPFKLVTPSPPGP